MNSIKCSQNSSQSSLTCSQHSQSEIQGVCLESECKQVVKLFCVNCLMDSQHSRCSQYKKFTLDQVWNQIGNLKLSDSISTQIVKQWLEDKQQILSLVEQLDQLMIKVANQLDENNKQLDYLRMKKLSQSLNITEYHELCTRLLEQCKIDKQNIILRRSDQHTLLLRIMEQYSTQIQAPMNKFKQSLITLSTNKGQSNQIQLQPKPNYNSNVIYYQRHQPQAQFPLPPQVPYSQPSQSNVVNIRNQKQENQ